MRFVSFLCFVIAVYLGTHAGEIEGAILKTLNLRLSGRYSDRQVYKEFIIAQLRRSVPTLSQQVYNLPVLSRTTLGIDFLYLRLTNQNGKQVTLAMDVANLYILGSAVYGKSQNISFFFNDVPQATRNKLFGDTTRRELSYGGGYTSLGNRLKHYIGIPALRDAIDELVTYKNNQPDRLAFLVVLQVLSEAARYKYIERKISETPGTFPTNFKPGAKIESLQNNWSGLSEQIQLAVTNGGRFKRPIQLQDDNFKHFNVQDVNSAVVKDEIAMLLNSRTVLINDRDNANGIDDDSNVSITTAAPSEVMVETDECGGGGADDEATVGGGCGHTQYRK